MIFITCKSIETVSSFKLEKNDFVSDSLLNTAKILKTYKKQNTISTFIASCIKLMVKVVNLDETKNPDN